MQAYVLTQSMEETMPKYKLLALDIDGTLINDDGQLTKTTKQWVGRAIKAGTTVMLTTGRMKRTAAGIRDELGLTGPMVVLNGAEVWREPGRLMQRHHLVKDKLREMHELALRNAAWYWVSAVEATLSRDEWPADAFEIDWMKFGMGHDDPHVLSRIKRTINEWDLYEVTSSHPTNIEVGPKGITKATALAAVCQELGIAMHDVMAIGDSLNDIHMIESVGFGVAMANAEPELKNVADAVTSSNTDNGVAVAIERYLLTNGV